MSIRLFFEMSKDFFDSMYSHFEDEVGEEGEYINEEVVIDEKQIDEEKGWNQYEDEANICNCNGCNIYSNIILFINPNIGDNKND